MSVSLNSRVLRPPSVRTTFPNGPSGNWAVAPLCPPGTQTTEELLSRPPPIPRLDSNLTAAGVAAGVERIPEPSGKKRDLPAVRSASAEWAGEWPACIPDSGRQAPWASLGVRQWLVQFCETVTRCASESMPGTFLFPPCARSWSLFVTRM